MPDLMFLDLLNKANTIVKQTYPAAEFYEADQPAPKTGNWRFVFNVPNPGKINGTAILPYINGTFQKVQFIDQPWLEDRVIPLPIKLDLGKAEGMAMKAGFPPPYLNTTLRWPLYPGVYEPSYIFGQADHFVFVGVYDGKVMTTETKVEALAGAYV